MESSGETFSKPAKLIITETPNEHGKYWTWVHWELEVNTMDLFMATEVVCRAWDASQNTQPAQLTWTLLGQGNNCMFRLRLHKDIDDKVWDAPCGTALKTYASSMHLLLVADSGHAAVAVLFCL